VTTPDGWPLWVSPVTEGSVHDLTAARAHTTGALNAAKIPVLADKAYWAAGATIHAPVRDTWAAHSRPLHVDNRQRNLLITALLNRGERAMAVRKCASALCDMSVCVPGGSPRSSPPRSFSPNASTAALTDNTSLYSARHAQDACPWAPLLRTD
jgi:hypothetical protein